MPICITNKPGLLQIIVRLIRMVLFCCVFIYLFIFLYQLLAFQTKSCKFIPWKKNLMKMSNLIIIITYILEQNVSIKIFEPSYFNQIPDH